MATSGSVTTYVKSNWPLLVMLALILAAVTGVWYFRPDILPKSAGFSKADLAKSDGAYSASGGAVTINNGSGGVINFWGQKKLEPEQKSVFTAVPASRKATKPFPSNVREAGTVKCRRFVRTTKGSFGYINEGGTLLVREHLPGSNFRVEYQPVNGVSRFDECPPGSQIFLCHQQFSDLISLPEGLVAE